MKDKPIWLPPPFPVNPWTEDTYDRLYDLFCRDFKRRQIKYDGNRVWFFSAKEDGKEKIFWHLTDRTDGHTGERFPDVERCARLPWARPMLDYHDTPHILAWDYEEGDGTVKTYVWLEDFDYVIIMKRMKDMSRRLITSFWIEYENTREKLRKKYKARLTRK